MRIGRLTVGLWTRPSGKYRWRDWGVLFACRATCGCYILQIGRLDFTWLVDPDCRKR
jgi:hypothetical protein